MKFPKYGILLMYTYCYVYIGVHVKFITSDLLNELIKVSKNVVQEKITEYKIL